MIHVPRPVPQFLARERSNLVFPFPILFLEGWQGDAICPIGTLFFWLDYPEILTENFSFFDLRERPDSNAFVGVLDQLDEVPAQRCDAAVANVLALAKIARAPIRLTFTAARVRL